MSHTIEIKNTLLEMRLQVVEAMNADAKPILLLYQALQEWEALGQIKEITLSPDPGDPNLYHFRVEKKDGLVCDQTWLVASDEDTDPFITINLSPAWQLSVMAFGGAIRKQLIEVRALVGIESFVVVFP